MDEELGEPLPLGRCQAAGMAKAPRFSSMLILETMAERSGEFSSLPCSLLMLILETMSEREFSSEGFILEDGTSSQVGCQNATETWDALDCK